MAVHRTWHLELDGQQHTVALSHGLLSGKRQVTVDGDVALVAWKLWDTGSRHEFEIGRGHKAVLTLENTGMWHMGMKFAYSLEVDGRELEKQ